MSLRIAVAVASAWLLGCTPELSFNETEQAAWSPGGDEDVGCPVWGCGSNSPTMAGIEFHEAHELGLPNAEGFRIVNAKKYVLTRQGWVWKSFRPDVINGELVVRDLQTNVIVYAGEAVAGVRFEVYNQNTNRTYFLHVDDVDRMLLWATPTIGVPRATRTYRLQWTSLDNPGVEIDLCGENPDGNDNTTDFYAVLYDDDRIDADAIVVYGETADWFTIGCAGSALAKQHLLAHTKAAGAITATTTTLAQRTANLKMITADYCGTGDPFTVPGQPLFWRDAGNWYNTLSGATELEARWTAAGATCLNTPRVDRTPTPLGLLTFPQGVEPLLAPSVGWCTASNPRPPPCDGAMSDMHGAHLVSAN